MSDHPFVSVIVPSYNRGHLLEKTIQSVLDQTEQDFELIIVDDGSTDNTKEVVQSFNDSRISYIYQQNVERAAARNRGIELSRGEYVTFLDSDDRFFPEHLKVVKAELKTRKPLFYFQPYCLMDADGRNKKYLPKLWNDLNLMIVKKGNVFSCHGVFLKHSLAIEHPFNSTRVLSGSEDYELWLRLAARVKFSFGNNVTSALIIHNERSVFNMKPADLIQRKEEMLKSLSSDTTFQKKYGDYMGLIRSGAYSYIALHLPVRSDLKKLKLKFWTKAIKLHPPFVASRRSLVIIRQVLLGH